MLTPELYADFGIAKPFGDRSVKENDEGRDRSIQKKGKTPCNDS